LSLVQGQHSGKVAFHQPQWVEKDNKLRRPYRQRDNER